MRKNLEENKENKVSSDNTNYPSVISHLSALTKFSPQRFFLGSWQIDKKSIFYILIKSDNPPIKSDIRFKTSIALFPYALKMVVHLQLKLFMRALRTIW